MLRDPQHALRRPFNVSKLYGALGSLFHTFSFQKLLTDSAAFTQVRLFKQDF
jgi:hypothetical protein